MGTEVARARGLTRAEVQADVEDFSARGSVHGGPFARAIGFGALRSAPRGRPGRGKPDPRRFAEAPEAGTWLESAVSSRARVLTPTGAVPAGQLCIGDQVETKDHGALPVQWIGLTHVSREQLSQRPALCPVRIRAGAIDGTYPREDLEVSPAAGLVMRSNLDRLDERLVSAAVLTRRDGFCKSIPRHGITYVQILLERHAVLVIEGLEMESFHPGNLRPTRDEAGLWSEVMAAIPELEHELATYGPRIRPDLRDRARI